MSRTNRDAIIMDLNLKGRVAVVTGGAAGIGEAIARALAAEGCTICLLDKNAGAARAAASAITTDGKPAFFAAADVADADRGGACFSTIPREHKAH